MLIAALVLGVIAFFSMTTTFILSCIQDKDKYILMCLLVFEVSGVSSIVCVVLAVI